MVRDAAVGEDVGEEELAAGLQDAEDLGEHPRLVRRQVDDAVRDHQVDGFVRDAGAGEVLDIALAEVDVGGVETEPASLRVDVLPRDVELLVGHVETDYEALGSHQLRRHVDVATGAAAQVEHRPALEPHRQRGATAVKPAQDLVVDLAYDLRLVWRQGVGGAARRGLEVAGLGEHLAVVLLDLFERLLGGGDRCHGVLSRRGSRSQRPRRAPVEPGAAARRLQDCPHAMAGWISRAAMTTSGGVRLRPARAGRARRLW